MNDTAGDPDAAALPLLRIVRGDPTDDELAALVAVVAARSTTAPDPGAAPSGRWAAAPRRLREPLRPGPGAWGASHLPR